MRRRATRDRVVKLTVAKSVHLVDQALAPKDKQVGVLCDDCIAQTSPAEVRQLRICFVRRHHVVNVCLLARLDQAQRYLWRYVYALLEEVHRL